MNKAKRKVGAFIDKLTNSIENATTGESFSTRLIEIPATDLKKFKKPDWIFNWKNEKTPSDIKVFGLVTINNPKIVHGLISFENKGDVIYVRLIESAKFNKGKSKVYVGVPGNLMAFACKVSFDLGYDGYVAFDAKTKLIEHYKKTLGAKVLSNTRMFIDTEAANNLVSKYKDSWQQQ